MGLGYPNPTRSGCIKCLRLVNMALEPLLGTSCRMVGHTVLLRECLYHRMGGGLFYNMDERPLSAEHLTVTKWSLLLTSPVRDFNLCLICVTVPPSVCAHICINCCSWLFIYVSLSVRNPICVCVFLRRVSECVSLCSSLPVCGLPRLCEFIVRVSSCLDNASVLHTRRDNCRGIHYACLCGQKPMFYGTYCTKLLCCSKGAINRRCW